MEDVKPSPSAHTTLVIGLGNPLLGDDGVGWRVAEQVQSEINCLRETAEVDCLAVGGLRLMERLIGYDRVILIDAITTGQHPPGHLTCCVLDDLPDLSTGHLASAHDTTLQTALKVGHMLGAPLPAEVLTVTVETEPHFEFSDDLTRPVAAAVAPAAQRVISLLRDPYHKGQTE